MTWTVHTCLITLAILCVWQAEVAETCRCIWRHPQEQFCSADMVMKAKVLGGLKVGITSHGNFSIKGYHIKQLKSFKRNCIEINTIYTNPSSASCGITLKYNTEYLLSGSLRDGKMHVSSCDFVRQWDTLTDSQREGVVSNYEQGCGCKITHCYSSPCAASSSAECLWGDEATETKLFGKRTTGYTCTMKSDKSCAWCKNGGKNCIDLKDA
ncbi:metalloproteinase inhibitor 2-like [Solea senegalensis]|uniref:Metalloproteinase inhibitor 2-like n=1 Tax=Solea senegalensis TaxID=28829 RepID=A0AAV6PKL7_SOLSE|nr:metalloproteinase inhibitor 2-like [Solea senegalensis]KAG7468715.1 metalloproteinase inhibitor 2-like [Solea senegalensis]